MTDRWIISGSHLAVESDDSIFHLSAQDVYDCYESELGVQNSLGLTCGDPREQTPYRFSKVGAPIKCEIICDDNNQIYLTCYFERKKSRSVVEFVEGHIIDQVVSNGEWFYLSGDVMLLNDIISNAGIKNNGPISMSQYLSIIRLTKDYNILPIDNKVTHSMTRKILHEESSVPNNLCANLYQYQTVGYAWMKYMLTESTGCILGDEMGLGKTLQVITLALNYVNSGRTPILVIAPVSLLENWKRECAKFAPDIDVYVHHGSKRTGFYKELARHDLVVISYSTASSDLSMLKMIQWEFIVVDEAQNMKNPYSERAKAIKQIPRSGSIAVSGTPFENHVQDIWSLVDFVIPGYFGSLESYKAEIPDDIYGAETVEPLLSPIMIRREVADVANELPEKIVIPQPIEMSDSEAAEYERYRQEAIDASSSGSVGIGVLQKLRMYCTHPAICTDSNCSDDDPYQSSIKYQRFCEIIEEIVSQNEKVLVFTSYKKMFDILSGDIPSRFSIPIASINGDTPVNERQQIVDWFNSCDGSAMLALNPRAAGTGLNITGANHVVHFNLEWNPELEDQASARAYRRGQTKTVFVYRLYYSNTVEEIVNQRIENKRSMFGAAIVGTTGDDLNNNDIIAALEMSPFTKE